MTHHGYLMMGHFYFNDVAHLRGGMRSNFYLLMLAIKTPLPVLVALGVDWSRSSGGEKKPVLPS